LIRDQKIREWYYRNRDDRSCEIARILDVEYAHLILDNGDDLYITSHGMPFIGNLRPENFWSDEEWFNNHSTKLSGSSSVYKVTTKKVNGISKDLVVKWNRMGQDLPGEGDFAELLNAEFNSPFEEFSLVMELRGEVGNPVEEVLIQKPLAIYVPYDPIDPGRSGRKKYKMQALIEAHEEVELDMNRRYAVIYEWIPGLDLVQAFRKGLLEEELIEKMTVQTHDIIRNKGYVVRDNKPRHVILTGAGGRSFSGGQKPDAIDGLVDFELLKRTPEREQYIKKHRRAEYLQRQRDRFKADPTQRFHPHLHHVNILGVNYIYGHVESTRGRLWVVGKDPYLFDYFLPERWEQTPRTKISVYNEMFYTITKDNIHLVWKVSNVGMRPDMDPFKEDERQIIEHGFNSPFEEVSIAMQLDGLGIPTIYPRAIYMSGIKTEISPELADSSRYESHQSILTPDGMPILEMNRDYIVIWGYWNGPDEKLASVDGDYYEGINTLRAYRSGIITKDDYFRLLKMMKTRLLRVGVEDINLRGSHLLISLDSKGQLVTDSRGKPEVRICNFAFFKSGRLESVTSGEPGAATRL